MITKNDFSIIYRSMKDSSNWNISQFFISLLGFCALSVMLISQITFSIILNLHIIPLKALIAAPHLASFFGFHGLIPIVAFLCIMPWLMKAGADTAYAFTKLWSAWAVGFAGFNAVVALSGLGVFGGFVSNPVVAVAVSLLAASADVYLFCTLVRWFMNNPSQASSAEAGLLGDAGDDPPFYPSNEGGRLQAVRCHRLPLAQASDDATEVVQNTLAGGQPG